MNSDLNGVEFDIIVKSFLDFLDLNFFSIFAFHFSIFPTTYVV